MPQEITVPPASDYNVATPLPTGAATAALQTTGNAALSVIETQQQKGFIQYQVSAEVIAGGNALYVVGDVVGPTVAADTTLANCARANGGSGISIGARLVTNNVLTIGALAQFRVIIYNLAAGTITPIADQDPNTLLYANVANRVGYIDFTQFITSATGSDGAESFGMFQAGNGSCLPFKADAAGRALSFRIEARAGVTLIANQKFTLILTIQPTD